MPTVKLASRRRLPRRQTERPTFGSPRPEQKCHKTQRQFADAKKNHHAARGDSFWRRRIGAGFCGISALVVDYQMLAVRFGGGGGDVVKQVSQWALATFIPFVCVSRAPLAQERAMLHEGWLIQSSAKVGVDGAAISAPDYTPAGWYRATVPSTVVGSLVEDGVYPDPFFGMNFRALPG